MNLARYLFAAAILGAGHACVAQTPPVVELPVSRIVLFSSGVGYFERDGQVEGNAKVDLKFPTTDINDLLKSLVLQDLNGGRISTVSYDNRDPVEHALKAFAIDLTGSPSLGMLLHQARGERVAISGLNDKGTAFQAEGAIIGVEIPQPVKRKEDEVPEQLNLMTAQGIESLALRTVQRIRFLKSELDADFRKALQVLAASHNQEKKAVTLNFMGNGKRKVRVGYVVESPIWKTSYRLSLDRDGNQDKAFLQGWAIVENTTDEDWTNVRLGLVSGRPISFRMDLYEPLFLQRPEIQLELFSSLRPPAYSRSVALNPAGGDGSGETDNTGRKYLLPKSDGTPSGGLGFGGGLGGLGGLPARPGQGRPRDAELDFRSSVVSDAIATESGRFFKYELEHPVTLARQKSSLLPIAQGAVEASKISIFNETVHAKHPLLGLRLKNTTGLHLMQGPITVFENGIYAGDARANDILPGETRLVSYGVDLGAEVVLESSESPEELVSVKIVKGIAQMTRKTRFRNRYQIKNFSDHESTLLVEHRIRPDRLLVAPERPLERTPEFYRFETKLKPKGQSFIDVVEDEKTYQQFSLNNLPDRTMQIYLKQATIVPRVGEALATAYSLKTELQSTQKAIQNENNALAIIEQDQTRMRANMERLPQTSEAFKRYLKKLDDQETEIEKRRAAATELQTTANNQSKRYDEFLANLNVE